jgi:hypothetical protein
MVDRPANVYEILVTDGHTKYFLPAPEVLPRPTTSPSNAAPTLARRTDRFIDHCLHAAIPAAQLQSRLIATYYAARTFLEEQGVDTLFLARAMPRWRPV